MLSGARIRWIQPGIESFSDHSLQLMHKGTNVLQNIQLLKWCTEYGIRVSWNYLLGFPGEDEQEVHSISSIIRAVHHLQPPGVGQIIHIDRFSTYFMTPQQYGLEPVRPASSYRHVYPFPNEVLERRRIRPWANFIGFLRNISEVWEKTVAKMLLKIILFIADLLCEKRSSDAS